MGLAPRHTLIAVQALLRCLFRNNIPFLPPTPSAASANSSNSMQESLVNPRLQTSPSIFEAVISNPYASFTLQHGLNIEANEMISSGASLSSLSPFRQGCGFKAFLATSGLYFRKFF